jgi:NADPH-dependent 2,4-dienoyl-CoA reductase/sulfur reductase-like enzyme/peroxiredoxin family protein/rhodanese-related sulfurtransferase/TusA-related sulfurtransferase
MKVIIAGGVAAGASAAARLRRLDESAEIILLEKGAFISYANCGLPYHLGGVIPERDDLLVMTPEKFASWFRIDVRTRNEAVKIDRANRTLTIRRANGEYTETYDKLLLAVGATPAGGTFPEDEYPHVTHLWTIRDMDRALKRLPGAKRAVIVGAGFIGLEAAENLRERGLSVTVVQRGGHVLPTLDAEMAGALADELAAAGIDVRFGRQVGRYHEHPDHVEVELDDGSKIEADLAIVSTGVRPNTAIAAESGLECGPRGHIIVDAHLRTSDPDIFAAGDAVEVVEPVFGGKTAVPLAGPANKQGRIAADNICGGQSAYRGSFGTSIVKVGRLSAGSVGLTEARLKDMGKPYRKLYIHPASNASYYPGGARLTLKLIFGADGTIYGAQIVGAKGVDKRIDTIAQAMRNGLKAQQLGELELAYAPPYSSAKDPVNFAGFVAEDILTGKSDVVYADAIPADAQLLDVREPDENELGAIPGAVNIPLGQLRERLNELDKNRLIVTYCQVGLRGYLAERILKQNGFRCANLSGGWLTWKMFHREPKKPAMQTIENKPAPSMPPASAGLGKLDVRTLPCPGPVVKLKAAMKDIPSGGGVHLLAPSTFEGDLLNWAKGSGCAVQGLARVETWIEADVLKGDAAQTAGQGNSNNIQAGQSAAIVVFSNDFDRAMAALILANGLSAAGMKVSMFFTFWGLSVLRKDPAPAVKKDFVSRMFGFMLPKGPEKLALSKLNMMGMGSAMMKSVMKKKHVLSLPELIRSAREAGVRFVACDMAMDVMGITREELNDVDEVAGVATFAELVKDSGTTLFI